MHYGRYQAVAGTADEIKVTNCIDNISRQALCDALDKTFADRIKMFDYDSYEKADEKTQLVCDGIMRAIDVVLGLPSAQPDFDITVKIDKAYDDGYEAGYLQGRHDWSDFDE